jgi:sulfatase modifying factor 1
MRSITGLVVVFFAVASVPAVTIDMVTVGNPGNAPNYPFNGVSLGSVGYTYEIGKYEITAGQYTAFLNAVAKNDTYALYHPSTGHIQRSGPYSLYSYSVARDWANRPVNNVSFWSAVRFANWLDNGQPRGAEGPGTTEDGAYINVGDQATFARQPGARFFIPTEDEWYKAAYHDKAAGLAGSYFDYPTGSNSVPGRDMSETTNPSNNANYYSDDYLIGSPYYVTEVGEFELSDSPYGTFDQGGNVWEWNETALFGTLRGIRAGSYLTGGADGMRSYYRVGGSPLLESPYVGFRVASIAVPEPSTIALAVAALGAFPFRRRRSI